MTVSFTFHDWPETRGAVTTLGTALVSRLSERGFENLTLLAAGQSPRPIWKDPSLVFAQTCGLPYVSQLRGDVQLLATPHYVAEGCAGADYSSILIAPRMLEAKCMADLFGCRAAINSWDSQSGCNALFASLPRRKSNDRFFASVVVTGSHAASLEAVADGRADCAAIDAVCWEMAKRHRPELASTVRLVGVSPPTPGLPFITAKARCSGRVAEIRAALREVFDDPEVRGARDAILLEDFSVLGDSAYDVTAAMAEQVGAHVRAHRDA